MAINCSRYTMHLIKILITITSPLCTLERKGKVVIIWKTYSKIIIRLKDYKRTL